jgi:hypothetical protein
LVQLVEQQVIQNSNSAVRANKHINEYSTCAGYREIGIPAVAAALCCEHMPAPRDEHTSKYEPPWSDRGASPTPFRR